jgi:ABC-type phosphate transport system auxiliary subunit
MSGPFCFVLHLGCVKEMGKEIWAFSTVASAAPAIWFDCAQRSISLISLISDLESIRVMSLGRRHVGL